MALRPQEPRWPGDVTLRFVKSYLKCPSLWNPKHKDYKNRKINERACKFIAESMKDVVKLDVNKVRNKIKTLRTTYSQEVAKILKNSTDPDHIHESNLVWFREMDESLKHVVLPRPPVKIQRDTSDWDTDIWEADSMDYSDEIIDSKKDLIEALQRNDPISIRDPILEIAEEDQKINNTIFSIPSQHTESERDEDEYDLFGKYVAAQLRKLQLKNSLRAKADILEIISTARLAET